MEYWVTEKYIYVFNQKDLLKVLDFKTLKKINNPLAQAIHQEQKEKFLAFFQTYFNAILENKKNYTLKNMAYLKNFDYWHRIVTYLFLYVFASVIMMLFFQIAIIIQYGSFESM